MNLQHNKSFEVRKQRAHQLGRYVSLRAESNPR